MPLDVFSVLSLLSNGSTPRLSGRWQPTRLVVGSRQVVSKHCASAPPTAWFTFTLLYRCNKNYKQGTPVVPPGSQFPVPATSYSTFLAFRCTPIYKPYVAEDLTSTSNNPGFIVDTVVTNIQVQDASLIDLVSTVDFLLVSISTGEGAKLAVDEHVPVNTTKFEIPFSLAELTPRQKPYNISCSATYPASAGTQEYTADASLSYLPNPPSGSITKFDSRTGGLWIKQFGGDADYTPVFPVGFYTDFDDYLAKDLSTLDDLKARG